MFPATLFTFHLALLYVFALLVITILITLRTINFRPQKAGLFLVLLSLFLRLLPIVFFSFASSYDVSAFRWAAGRVFDRQDIYYSLGARHRYAFLPTFALITSSFLKISSVTQTPFLFWEKLPIIIFDSLIGFLIFKISKSFKQGLIYAVSPLGIIVGAFLGQFEAITIFFLILALFLLKLDKRLQGAFSLGLSVLFKPWPILFLPFFLFWGKRLSSRLKVLLAFLFPLLSVLLYYKLLIPQARLFVMLGGIIIYGSVIGWWGFSLPLRFLAIRLQNEYIYQIPAQLVKLFIIALIIFVSRLTRKIDLFQLAKITFLIIYVFSLGLGIHYLIWIYPLVLITRDKLINYYQLIVGGYLILFGFLGGLNLNFTPPATPEFLYYPLSFFTWCFFVFWFFSSVRNTIRNYLYSPN